MRWSPFADIIKESFEGLFPGRQIDLGGSIRYSGRFRGFNANVRLRGNVLEFNLSRQWRRVDPAIQVGLVQDLMLRILKKRGLRPSSSSTINSDLYHQFLKSVHVAVPKTRADPVLVEAFSRLNEEYFSGVMDAPNLRFGRRSFRKLGSYEFGTDTITISSALHPSVVSDDQLLLYVLYHEMLHKKHKYHAQNGRTCSHTPAFREEESRFKGALECEARLKGLSRRAVVPPLLPSNHPFSSLLRRVMG